MNTKGVTITKGQLGPNRLGGADSISGIILQGLAVADKIALGEVKTIYSAADAEVLGLDAAYDITNNVRVHYHISEFFRMAGNGTKLYLMLVAQTKTLTHLADIADADNFARKLITEAKGEIRQLAIGLNVAAAYTSVILNGIDSDVLSAIPKAQGLAEWGLQTDRPFQVLLEGRELTGAAASIQDLRDITNVKATKVSVVIGQDFDYAETLNALGRKHAAIGTALGCVAAARINQNIGEVDEAAGFNLTNATQAKWLTAGLSSHVKISSVEGDWDTLDEKGYIFAQTYTSIDGTRWNNDHTCTPIIKDAEGKINEYTISLGRTVDKAVRKLRTALLPKVKSVQPINPATGKLPVGIVKYFEGLGDNEFADMARAGELSDGKAYVDPESNLLTAPRILNMGFSLTPYGTIDEIKGTINLKATI